jgi:hypothetical protein
MVYRGLGQPRRARASLRRCRQYDYERRWRWEVENELQRLKKGKPR